MILGRFLEGFVDLGVPFWPLSGTLPGTLFGPFLVPFWSIFGPLFGSFLNPFWDLKTQRIRIEYVENKQAISWE